MKAIFPFQTIIKKYAFKAFPQPEPETEESDWSALSLVRTMDDVFSRPLNRSPYYTVSSKQNPRGLLTFNLR